MGAAHHLRDWRWCVAGVAAWIAAALSSWVTIPLMYPYEDPRTFVTTGAVAGLIVPLAVCGIVLDEGPPALLASAGRTLALWRVGWAVGYIAGMSALAWVESRFILPISIGTFVADALFVASAAVCGVGLVGLRGGWLLPAVVIAVFSVPGLVPWTWNWIYRTDEVGHMLVVGLASAGVGVAMFAAGGSRGLLSPASSLGTHARADDWA
jgi:hypothetical protein